MKGLLLDQGLAPKAATLLRASGWDAVHAAEIGLDRAERDAWDRQDGEIVDCARRHDRVCVTFDHDFHSHLALTRADGPSVIFIRAEGLDSLGQSELITKVYEFCGRALDTGAAVSVDRSAIRVRKLPLS